MKHYIVPFLLCLSLIAGAQNAPQVRDFRGVTDSLQVRLQRQMGVDNKFRLEKVTKRGKAVDFYYTQNLANYPWRPGDITWFREQLRELGSKGLGSLHVGNVYAKKQNIAELPIPAITNDGQPVSTGFRVKDPRAETTPLVKGSEDWPMGLSGRHIALWQSHGRYWEETTQRWEWQRSATHTTVEDLYTQSIVLPFLIPMLEQAGAVVLTPRERDTQTWEVVCDNDPAFKPRRDPKVRREGSYEEKGDWETVGPGFADAKERYSGVDNPFKMGTARMIATTKPGESESQALWRPDIPEKGNYAVYVSYTTLARSTDDARYTVHHLGGESLLHVNQQMSGGTWVYLGTYLFDKGTEGYVSLTSQSSAGGVVCADAVRFGGGMGKVEREGTLSGLPAYVEGALYNFQYAGLDMDLLERWEGDYRKDLSARGVWVNEMAGGSRVNPEAPGRRVPLDLALACHSDAGVTPNDSIVGTLTIYTLRNENSDDFPSGESRMSSRLLADWVQSQVVDDIRAGYEPNWMRRDIRDRSYSECRVPHVPSMILELLSHQNFADMRYGLDPSFRFTAARSVYKGILKYLSARYNCQYAVQPLPVHNFSARLEKGRTVLTWSPTSDTQEPTATPKYYKIYTRRDDGAFDQGLQIKDTICNLSLQPGHIYSYKITACNEGGESFPSEILAVGKTPVETRKVHIVNNFTRVSAPASFDSPAYAGFNTRLDAGVPWGQDILFAGEVNQFDRSREWTDDDNPGFGGSFTDHGGTLVAGNSFDFVAQHGRAILASGYSFDSSSVEAFTGEGLNAFAVDLICGKQLTTRMGSGALPDRYTVFPEALQEALKTYTNGGGHVLISGAYIASDAWDPVYQGVAKAPDATRSFVKTVLGYQWVTNYGDYSGQAIPAPGSDFPAATYNRDWSPLLYRVENPDGIAPASAKTQTLLRYKGTDIPAATFMDNGRYRVAAFGFPLEVSPQMGDIIKRVLTLFQ